MELTFIDVKKEYQSILLEILDELDIKRINRIVKYQDPYVITFGAPFGTPIEFGTKDIEVDTSYEKFEYAKYLLIKKIKEAKKEIKSSRKMLNTWKDV